MSTPTLVRIRRKNGVVVQDCDLYIGRAMNMGGWRLPKSKWHNPFTIKEYGSREIVCQKYLEYIINSELFHQIPELESQVLGCWCDKPKDNRHKFYCHGCVLIYLYKYISRKRSTRSAQKSLKKKYNI